MQTPWRHRHCYTALCSEPKARSKVFKTQSAAVQVLLWLGLRLGGSSAQPLRLDSHERLLARTLGCANYLGDEALVQHVTQLLAAQLDALQAPSRNSSALVQVCSTMRCGSVE